MVGFTNPILLKIFSSECLSNTSEVTQQERQGQTAIQSCLTLTPRSPSSLGLNLPHTGARGSLSSTGGCLPLLLPKLPGNAPLPPPGMLSRSGRVFVQPGEIFHAAPAAGPASPRAPSLRIGRTQRVGEEAQMTSQLPPASPSALGARALSVRACV